MTRKITSDEKALWRIATKEVKSTHDELEDFVPRNLKVKITQDIRVAEPSVKPAPAKTSLITRMIEKDNFKKLASGKTKLDARLDLHGMWLNQAHQAVINFIQQAYSAKIRRLLIITGKGGLDGGGKIRSELPRWLEDEKIYAMVSSYSESGKRHGGGGAFYVILRRQ